MRRQLTRIILVTLAVAALATAGIVANLVLLGHADSRNDPVGKLTPRASIPEQTRPGSTPTTTTNERTEPELEERDD
jgi:hypothetical protein